MIMEGRRDKIRVLEVIQTIGIGGAEMVTLNTARFLDRSRFEVRALVVGGGELIDLLRQCGCEVDTFEFTHSYNREFLRFVRRLILRHRIDVIHTHLSRMNIYGFLASRLTPAANVMTVHGLTEFSTFRGRLYYSLFGNLSGRVVTVSHLLAERFHVRTKVRRDRITVIPNGIDIERFGRPVDRTATLARFGISPEAGIVLAVGNIRVIKGYEFLIESFSRIAAEEPRLRLVICGNDYSDHRRNLEPLVAAHSLSGRVIFADFVPDIERLYAVADLYALTSVSEGFSLTTVEAMASSAAVVSTDCVGPREIIDDGVDGIIVSERDPDLFGRTMLELYRDEPRRRTLGRAARAKAESRYTIKKTVGQFEQLFESLVIQ